MLICNVAPLEEHIASVRLLVATADQQTKHLGELKELEGSHSFTKLKTVMSGEFEVADALEDLMKVFEAHKAAFEKIEPGSSEDNGVMQQTVDVLISLLAPMVNGKVLNYWQTFTEQFLTAMVPNGDEKGLPNLERLMSSLAACQLVAILPSLQTCFAIISDAAGRFSLKVAQGVDTGAQAPPVCVCHINSNNETTREKT